MLLAEKQKTIVEELSLIPDAYERLGYLVEYGKNLSKLEPSLKIDQFMIEGCLSQLWIGPKFELGKCIFQSESDSAIVHGIAGLLCDFYSHQPPEEIINNDASVRSNSSSYGVVNESITPRNGLLVSATADF